MEEFQLKQGEHPVAEDPYSPLAVIFRRACEAVRPEVALVNGSPLAATSERVDRDLYDLVLGFLPDLLVGGYPFKLLYFDSDRTRTWTPGTGSRNQTEIEVGEAGSCLSATGDST